MAVMIRELGEAGLSSREGCGNTVRNVTGDPRAGTLADELFDITPYAGAYVRYFVRHPTTQMMPRKIKTAFTATDADNAITQIHDIAFIPRAARRRARRRDPRRRRHLDHAAARAGAVRVRRARQRRLPEGLRGRASGSSTARTSCASTAPAPASRCWSTRSGSTPSASMVEEELQGDWVAERDFSIDGILFEHRRAGAARRRRRSQYGSPNGDQRAVRPLRRRATSQPQRQRGFSTVEVKIHRGDLTPEQLRGLGQIMRDYSGGYARTTVQQNLVLRWVRDEAVYDVWKRARGSSSSATPAPTRSPTSSAAPAPTPASSGSPARWASTGRSSERLVEMEIDDELTRKIHIKMSGCPNGCSQHHSPTSASTAPRSRSASTRSRPTSRTSAARYENGDVRFGDAAQEPPAGQARARRGRALGALLRVRASSRARSSTPSPPASAPPSSRSRSRTWRCRSSSPWRT